MNEPSWSARQLRAELDRYEAELRAAGKARNTINTYVQHPERFINWLEGRYRPAPANTNWMPGPPSSGPERATFDEGPAAERFGSWMEGQHRPTRPDSDRQSGLVSAEYSGPVSAGRMSRGSSRYDPLRAYLAERTDRVVRLSFGEIERILGGPLPASARRHRPWWANERSGSHVHASAWIGAGRRTANVDLNAAMVDFVQ